MKFHRDSCKHHSIIEDSYKLSSFQLPKAKIWDVVYEWVYNWVFLKWCTDYSVHFTDWKNTRSFQKVLVIFKITGKVNTGILCWLGYKRVGVCDIFLPYPRSEQLINRLPPKKSFSFTLDEKTPIWYRIYSIFYICHIKHILGFISI